MWFIEMPIIGRRMSPAAFVATEMFLWTMSSDLMRMLSADWLETGLSKKSDSSVNWGRIFCVNVCSRAFVWFRTDETKLSTFRPAVSTSENPLCRSSFPYKPEIEWKLKLVTILLRVRTVNISSSALYVPSPIAPQHSTESRDWHRNDGKNKKFRISFMLTLSLTHQ